MFRYCELNKLSRTIDESKPRDFSQFEKRVVKISDSPCTSAESGFFTLLCMKNFDGGEKIHTTNAIIQKFKEYLLFEVFRLKDNRDHHPSVPVKSESRLCVMTSWYKEHPSGFQTLIQLCSVLVSSIGLCHWMVMFFHKTNKLEQVDGQLTHSRFGGMLMLSQRKKEQL